MPSVMLDYRDPLADTSGLADIFFGLPYQGPAALDSTTWVKHPHSRFVTLGEKQVR